MKPVRSLYYVAQKGKMLDFCVSAWTWFLAFVSFDWKRLKFNFSHEEKWFPNANGKFDTRGVPITTCFYGQCFSSTMRGSSKGVRFAPAEWVLRNPGRWWYGEEWVPDEQYDKMLAAAQGEVDKKYDYWGLFTGFFLLAPYLQDDVKRYCSDICCWLDWLVGLLHKRLWIVSPRRSARIREKRGVVLKPLVEIK